ncbi:MAG: hypothetical protein RLN90_03910 [Balneolaceae bacterium]
MIHHKFTYLVFFVFFMTEITIAQHKTVDPWELVFNIEYSNPGRSTYGINIINQNSEVEYHSRTEFRPSVQLGLNYTLNRSFFLSGRIGWADNGHLSNRTAIPGFDESTHTYRALFLSTGTGLGYNSPTILKILNLELSTHLVVNMYLKEISNEPEFSSIDLFSWTNYLSNRSNLSLKFNIFDNLKISTGIYLDYNLMPTTKQIEPQDSINNNILRTGLKLGINYRL